MKPAWFSLVCIALCLQGCAVITVANVAVSVASTAVKASADVVGAGVHLAAAGVRAVTGSSTPSK